MEFPSSLIVRVALCPQLVTVSLDKDQFCIKGRMTGLIAVAMEQALQVYPLIYSRGATRT